MLLGAHPRQGREAERQDGKAGLEFSAACSLSEADPSGEAAGGSKGSPKGRVLPLGVEWMLQHSRGVNKCKIF